MNWWKGYWDFERNQRMMWVNRPVLSSKDFGVMHLQLLYVSSVRYYSIIILFFGLSVVCRDMKVKWIFIFIYFFVVLYDLFYYN